jgi:hypothetical protein
MVRRSSKTAVKRVEMTSSVSARPILVPEQHVERYQLNGWTLVPEAKPARRKTNAGNE